MAAAGWHRSGRDRPDQPTDYFLYLPLLPEVAAGILDPRRGAVPLAAAGPGVRTVPGTVDEVDIAARSVGFTDPEGIQRTMSYDRLLLTVSSVGRLLPVPGLTEHAIGFRSIREGLALRDHLVRQIKLAAAAGVAPAASSSGPDGTPDQAGLQGQARLRGAPSQAGPADPSGPDGAPGRFAAGEQDARCTFVVVGAGYTGTEVAAHGQLLTRAVAGNYPALRHQQIRWLLLETAPASTAGVGSASVRQCPPGADRPWRRDPHRHHDREGGRRRRADVRRRVRSHPLPHLVRRSAPDPLVGTLDLATSAGRLSVDEYLGVPGHPEIFACGDAAAVPDLTSPGEITAMTAQHAVRQGRRVAGNIAASFGYGRRRPYRHHDLGFTVDLGGAKAAANPAGLRLSGVLAKAVTRGLSPVGDPGQQDPDRLRLATRRRAAPAGRATRAARGTSPRPVGAAAPRPAALGHRRRRLENLADYAVDWAVGHASASSSGPRA